MAVLIIFAVDLEKKLGQRFDPSRHYRRGQVVSVRKHMSQVSGDVVGLDAFRVVEVPDMSYEEALTLVESEVEDLVVQGPEPDAQEEMRQRRVQLRTKTINLSRLEAEEVPDTPEQSLSVSRQRVVASTKDEPTRRQINIIGR